MLKFLKYAQAIMTILLALTLLVGGGIGSLWTVPPIALGVAGGALLITGALQVMTAVLAAKLEDTTNGQ